MVKSIMIQGTMSNVGKSIVTTALCRIFKQDGFKVAPFKSQNMALNSFITKDSLEMSRSQTIQAESAGIEPDVRMNPILLKPMNNTTSQVIVNGKILATFSASNYYKMKNKLKKVVSKAYHELAQDYDIIVIEGAGSPAELNLMQNDYVNMGMAKIANAPVILVGDIDRGGIFPQLYGTLELLPAPYNRLVKATLVNKFRGDRSLFADGLQILEKICKVPCAGLVPMLNVDIEEEDSLTERLHRPKKPTTLDIAVIGMPHISNFTDFTVLEATPGIGLRYVNNVRDLGTPDLVILPGTKNTIDDFLNLRECGLETAIKQLAALSVPVFGICGGYQMLGEHLIEEEENAGTDGRSIIGMGLLPITTRFTSSKRRTRVYGTAVTVEGIFSALSQAEVEGYEIHMGQSERAPDAKPLLQLSNGTADGCQSKNVYGTYLHGFFDRSNCREAILNALATARG